jgi:hypothetical protein
VAIADYLRRVIESEPAKVLADRYHTSGNDIYKLKGLCRDVLAPELERHGLTLTNTAELDQLRADLTAYKRAAFAAMRDSYHE